MKTLKQQSTQLHVGFFFLTKKKINSYFGTMTRTNSFVLECCEAIIKQMSYFSFVNNMP